MVSFKLSWKIQLICLTIAAGIALIFNKWITKVFETYLLSNLVEYPTGNIMLLTLVKYGWNCRIIDRSYGYDVVCCIEDK